MSYLKYLFLSLVFFVSISGVSHAAKPEKRFPILSNDEAWKHLPPLQSTDNVFLPIWARILSRSLPKTTAMMLELDYLHRAAHPLDAVLRGKVRWVIAHVNHCDYSREHAERDLRAAGVKEKEIAALYDDIKDLPEMERAVLTYAKKLTLKGSSVTDDDFAVLVKHLGAKKVVALTHLIAHGNFQDRIFLALGLTREPGGARPPMNVHFKISEKDSVTVPERKPWKQKQVKQADPNKQPDTIEAIEQSLKNQHAQNLRLPIPDWTEARKEFPPEDQKRPVSKILWSRVSIGYQPTLTLTWFKALRQFNQEAKLNGVFENSLFWVITNRNECFY